MIGAEAATWLAILRGDEASADDRRRFDAWRGADVRHEAAFDKLEKTWGRMSALAPQYRQSESQSISPTPIRLKAFFGKFADASGVLAAACLAIISVVVVIGLQEYRQPPESETIYAGAEPLTEQLPDGTIVHLNASTRIEVAFTPSERLIRLGRGQAQFIVAPDKNRPLTVTAGEHRVVAIGTAFDVLQGSQSVVVTLLEGVVDVMQIDPVSSMQTHDDVIRLAPGERISVAAGRPPIRRTVDLANVGAWRRGRVVLQAASLEDAVNEIGQYAKRRIIIGDAVELDRPINFSGPINEKTAAVFLKALDVQYAISARQLPDGALLLEPQRAPERNQ